MARPSLPDDQRRSELLKFRASPDEQATIKAGADAVQVGLSEFMRDAALEKAHAIARKRKRATR